MKQFGEKCLYSSRAPETHRSTSAAGRRADIPANPAKRQLHIRGRPHHPEGGGVQDDIWKLDRDPRRQLAQLQAVAPGSRHRV